MSCNAASDNGRDGNRHEHRQPAPEPPTGAPAEPSVLSPMSMATERGPAPQAGPGSGHATGNGPEPAGPEPTGLEPTAGCDRKLLELLVCPVTHTTLSYDAARQELISRAARLAFPIRNGIPILVREEARPLD